MTRNDFLIFKTTQWTDIEAKYVGKCLNSFEIISWSTVEPSNYLVHQFCEFVIMNIEAFEKVNADVRSKGEFHVVSLYA